MAYQHQVMPLYLETKKLWENELFHICIIKGKYKKHESTKKKLIICVS